MGGDAALEYDNMCVDGSGLLAKIQLIEILGVIFVASTTGNDGPPLSYARRGTPRGCPCGGHPRGVPLRARYLPANAFEEGGGGFVGVACAAGEFGFGGDKFSPEGFGQNRLG